MNNDSFALRKFRTTTGSTGLFRLEAPAGQFDAVLRRIMKAALIFAYSTLVAARLIAPS